MKYVIPTAEPFFFPGSRKTGVLLIHGFTGAPKEMRWMGEYLHQNYGFSVLGIRLAGHATTPEDMIRTNYTDWLASVEDGANLLRGMVENLYLAGLSMGGILSLSSVTRLDAKGVVAMSTPYKLPDDPRLRHIDMLARITPYMPKSDKAPDSGWFDKEAFKGHVSYPQNPLRSIGELNKLMGFMRAALPGITVPVQLIHSHGDDYVIKNSMELIFADLVSTTDKHMLWLEKSGHVVTRDIERGTVFQTAGDFIARVEGLA